MLPTQLRCEHVPRPLAVAARRPRFSWFNESDRRGARQTSYQIVVFEGEKEMWDSGTIRSAEQAGIPYGGKSLESFRRYTWRVRVWDDRGKPGAFSEPTAFETGALDPAGWTGKWITRRDAKTEESGILKVTEAFNDKKDLKSHHAWALYFAKGFSIDAAVTRARAYVSGLGYYELSINGRTVGDHRLDPGQTDYETGALYVAFEIDDHLIEGVNTVLLTLANGRHIDAYGYPFPRGIVELHIECAGETKRVVATDDTWCFDYGPIHENGIYLGEHYDAGDEPRIDRLLARATKEARSNGAGARTSRGGTRGGRGTDRAHIAKPVALRPQLMPPIRATREFRPIAMTNPRAGTYVFDFGQNMAGVVRLRGSGPKGTRVLLRHAELVGADGDLHLGTNREAPAIDAYTMKGEGIETFEPRFTYHGFRYVRLTGYPGTPTLDSVTAVALHTDAPQTGRFACSKSLINRIHENTLWSQRSNLMSIPTDCPQRGERMGWLGDAQLASEQAMCNFDMAAFYAKYLEDIRASQHEDGSLSDVTPAYWQLYPSDPAWATAYVTLAWHLYYSYGDREILELHYASMKRYVDFLEKSADKHIIRKLGKYGDWCPPGSIFPKQTPIELTSTWYYYYDTLRFSHIAGILGKESDRARYAKRADEILRAFNDAFLLEDGRYATLQMSPIDRAPGQTSQALPLFLDMVPRRLRAAAVEKLVTTIVEKFDSHVDTGIVGTRYLFEVLRDEGHAELAYRMITQETYPGWGYMIERGATTIWERWEDLRGFGMNSHNHIMLGSVDAWFYRTLAGITQTAPSWRRATVAPRCLGDLTHASATIGTLYGPLSAAWSKDERAFRLDVEIPVGVQAEVRIPRGDGNERLLEGRSRLGAGSSLPAGVKSYTTDGSAHVITVGAGSYHFERIER